MMKYIVMLGDGMADYSLEELGGKTPLQAAVKPNMDYLAQHGTVGMVKTVPDGMPPQSDTANLSVMGYDPLVYYTGRSPLEAVSMGIELGAADLAFRCNLVCISEEENYEENESFCFFFAGAAVGSIKPCGVVWPGEGFFRLRTAEAGPVPGTVCKDGAGRKVHDRV